MSSTNCAAIRCPKCARVNRLRCAAGIQSQAHMARAGDVTPALESSVTRCASTCRCWRRGDGYFAAVAKLMGDVAAGLEYAHQMQVIHRDVKPSNLLLSHDGDIHISDFGLARLADEPGLTRTGDVIGTPFYMAPEQISAAAGEIDGRTDIYALGRRFTSCSRCGRRLSAKIASK